MSSDAKTTFDPAETESVGDRLGYGKDSKERGSEPLIFIRHTAGYRE